MTNIVICVLVLTCLLPNSKCVRKDMEGFVVGGFQVKITDNPHSVYLEAKCGPSWMCGSSVLNQRILITAGHCLYGCRVGQGHRVEASAGSSNLLAVKIKRSVTRLVVHGRYDEKKLENDIALAFLNSNIPLGRNIKRVIIKRNFPFNSYIGKVAGWGTVDEDTELTSTILKQVSQKLRSKFTCAKIGDLIPGMFCAGSENFYEDHPAEGDSGSALITDEHTAIGLVSFRIPVYPALMVYTNLSYYYDWVTMNAKDMYCNG